MGKIYEFLHKKMPPEKADKLSIIISLVAIICSVISLALRLR